MLSVLGRARNRDADCLESIQSRELRIGLTLEDRAKEQDLFSLEKTEENMFFKNMEGSYRKDAYHLFRISMADRISSARKIQTVQGG